MYNIINGVLEKKYQESLYDECELLINKELNGAISIAGYSSTKFRF